MTTNPPAEPDPPLRPPVSIFSVEGRLAWLKGKEIFAKSKAAKTDATSDAVAGSDAVGNQPATTTEN